MRSFCLFLLLIILAAKSDAIVFRVTSNANGGPGTLRQAIIDANNVPGPHVINFNISPRNTITDVTIVLATELPKLPSNIIIDGRTQPASSILKISIVRGGADFFYGLILKDIQNVEIYGLNFQNFNLEPGGLPVNQKAGIYLDNVSKITIKENSFGNNYAGVISALSEVALKPNLDQIVISENQFGFTPDGINKMPNFTGINLSYLKTGSISGNLISNHTFSGIELGDTKGTVYISNNIIGLNAAGALAASVNATGITANGSDSSPIITQNTIVGQKIGIYMDGVNGKFIIEANKIGSSNTLKNATGIYVRSSQDGTIRNGNVINYNDIGIYLEFAKHIKISKDEISFNKVAIGSKNTASIAIEESIIWNNQTAISNHDSYPVTLSKNSASCNAKFLEFLTGNPPAITNEARIVIPKIEFVTPSSIKGTYLPNASIELFYTDNCGDCQGKVFIASIPTDASGTWTYNGTFTGAITCTGTNSDLATSAFSKPMVINTSVKIVNVICGQTTGSIKGLEVYDSSIYKWYDATGTLVGTQKDLENVGAGTYTLTTGQNGLCDTQSGPYVVSGSGNSIDATKIPIIVDVLCNSSKGSIKGIFTINDLDRYWYNISNPNLIVSNADDLVDVPAGSYYFTTGSGPCLFKSPNYTIKNTDINYTVLNKQIIPANCDLSNGSITILSFQGDTPLSFSWLNETGLEVAQTKDLKNQAAGKYRLIASNGLDCANIAGEFEIGIASKPQVNLLAMKRYLSCDEQSVSSSGISIIGETGPYQYQWLDENNKNVYEGLDLQGVKKGRYKLTVTDKYGCMVESDVIDFNEFEVKSLRIPNTFSPNGDGINDNWVINGTENYPTAEFNVFDRNGNRVFYNKGYTKNFDGFYNGQLLPVGVYYYIVDLKGKCKPLSGSLTIIR